MALIIAAFETDAEYRYNCRCQILLIYTNYDIITFVDDLLHDFSQNS
jgi:hypothetical protein